MVLHLWKPQDYGVLSSNCDQERDAFTMQDTELKHERLILMSPLSMDAEVVMCVT